MLQNYGFMFVIDPISTRIEYCSSNVPSFFKKQTEEIWNLQLIDWIPHSQRETFRSLLKNITYKKTSQDGKNPYIFRMPLSIGDDNQLLACAAGLHWAQPESDEDTPSEWLAVLEFEPLPPKLLVGEVLTTVPKNPETIKIVDVLVGNKLFYLPHVDSEFYLDPSKTLGFFRTLETMLDSCTTISLLTETIPRIFRKVLGHEQGLLYEFENDMSTKVIATDTDPKSSFTETYRDFKFPKTTIPMEVWQKYVLQANRVRVCYDGDQPGIQLVPSPTRSNQPINFSRSEMLRNSDVHLEFMKAMKVRGQLSLNLLCGRNLWAVLSIHSTIPRRLGLETREIISRMGSLISCKLESLMSQERINDFQKLAVRPVASQKKIEPAVQQDYIHKPNRIRPLVGSLIFDWKTLATNAAEYLVESLSEILPSFSADACGVCIEDVYRIKCIDPELHGDCDAIISFLRNRNMTTSFSTSEANRNFPESAHLFQRVYGLLYLPLSKNGDTFAILFRKENVKRVVWNADPAADYKPGDINSYPEGLWEEEIRGASEEWTNDDLRKSRFVHSIYQRFIDVYKEKQNSVVHLRRRTTLIDGVAAEIRDALHRILDTLKTCKTNLNRSELIQYLGFGEDACRSLLNIVSDFAYFSKVEAGDVIIREEEFSIKNMILSVASLFEIPCRQRGLEWHLKLDPQIDNLYVRGDPTRLRQIICNLCGNAIKFTNVGHIWLTVELARKLEPHHTDVHLLFEIADTGIGIPQDSISRLFNQFERLQGLQKTKYRAEGTGLGLAIVSRLIEALQGTLAVETVENEGSKFQFTLTYPIVSRDQALVESQMTSPKDPIIEALVLNLTKSVDIANDESRSIQIPQKDPSRLRILIAEDNLVNQKLLKKRLETDGHKVLVASNGKECVDLFLKEQEPVDVILMDVKMPLMSGVEATELIRSQNHSRLSSKTIPIIGVSADIDYDSCKTAGMSGYISKPVDYPFLKNMLKEISLDVHRTEKRRQLDVTREECKGWF